MGSSQQKVVPSLASTASSNQKAADGWDDEEEDWESFNDVKPKPQVERRPAPSSSDLPMPSLSRLSVKPEPVAAIIPKQDDSWNDGGDDWSKTKFTPVNEDTEKSSRMDEAKRKREERKQQRLKEIEAKRAANKSGPMKLGAQKDKMLWDELE